ncbi:MAG: LON peptidase substrate-binding domain-containing protein [Candidatus Obscuribacterales bacterium]|nr:LON peptidase substrate-binding domain-containing protein [Candidatus Obscuribacterales bacterium]
MVASTWAEAIPLFPLPEVVLFPGGWLPLHIYEPRYREMIADALKADSRFGVVMIDPSTGQASQYGCSAVIVNCKRLQDGRMNIMTVGQQRFRLIHTNQEKPYIVGQVEWIDDNPTDKDLKEKASALREILKDVVRLSGKLSDKAIEFPEDLPSDPIEFSYWVAGSVYGLTEEQQSLLELEETDVRLEREADILLALRKELAARTALKDAFSS